MKIKTAHICSQCEYQSSKWLGKCPQCNAWNSFTEEIIQEPQRQGFAKHTKGKAAKVTPLSLVKTGIPRIVTGISECDRVLGGGIVPGSLILLGGEPGIGKSTLTLQLAAYLAETKKKVLYVSGEESAQQISLRAQRLNVVSENLALLPENLLETILATIEKELPDILIIDSIQAIASDVLPALPGSITQVRLCAEALMQFAKKSGIPLILIGHVTKEGNLAGPKVLEHLVDTVLYLEGDRFHELRVLRGIKNRFGSTNEIGLFEMQGSGMKEMKNPSAKLLAGRKDRAIGSVVTCVVEGTRPLLVEMQALTSKTAFGYPRRTTSGFNINRLHLLLAVIERNLGIPLASYDVYANITGGLTVEEPAGDLALCLATLSSYQKIAISADTAAIGEVSLAGEIRSIPAIERRIDELSRLGFTKIFGPPINKKHQNYEPIADIRMLKANVIKSEEQQAPKIQRT